MPNVRIATYNIHRCRGMDRRVNPARIIDVLRDIAAGKETVGDTTTLEDYSVLAKIRGEEE